GAAGAAASAAPMAIDNRCDLLVLPPVAPEDEERVRSLEKAGHRVLVVPPEEATFERLDILRREGGNAATLVLAPDPSWKRLTERLHREQNWPSAVRLPASLSEAFPLVSV